MAARPKLKSFLPSCIGTPLSLSKTYKVLSEYAIIVSFYAAPRKEDFSLALNLNGIKLLRLAAVIKLNQQ